MLSVWPLLLFVNSSTVAPIQHWIADVVSGHNELPALSEVQSQAVAALALPDDSDVRSWSRRARSRGVVPRLDFTVGTDRGYDVRDALSDATPRITRDSQALALDLGLHFELGELVFSDFELRANREALARAATLRLARERVTRLYFERVRTLWALQHSSVTVERAIEAAQLDGLLRAYTGGRYALRVAPLYPSHPNSRKDVQR